MQGISTPAEVPAITPFWQRMPHFFRYPLHVEPLLYMAMLSLATLLGFILPLPSPLDHLIVHLGVWLAFIRYAYKTLDQTSLGLLTPEQHQFYDAKERANLPYKQFAIFLVTGFAISLAGFLGNVAVGLMMIFFVLAMPASIMILSITQSFWAGLNPFAAVGMMRVIGLPYLGLCAFLFLLSSSQGILQMELVPRVPEWLMVPTLNFVAMYFTLIMFNMMGYVVYQYHALLGVEISASVPATGPVATAVDAIGALIAAGQVDEAVELAYEAQRASPDDLAAHDRYHKLLLLAGRTERAESHARSYLSLLLQKGRGEQALDLHREMQARTASSAASFEPEQPGQLLQLAEAARRRREYAAALALIKGFDKRFPRHPQIPVVYLFAASVLCENLRQDAAARQILGVLLARYPEHPIAGEARQLATVIDKLADPASA